MILTYDMATGQLEVDTSGVRPHGTNIEARLRRYGQVIPFDGLSFGAVVTADGTEIFRRAFPRANEVWRQTDQDLLWAGGLRWSPDQAIEVHAWIANGSAGARVERETTQAFNVPRPAQPWPSWTWGGTAWQAPVPHPDDGGTYDWDEAGQVWVAVAG
jgi:hypothetical protein